MSIRFFELRQDGIVDVDFYFGVFGSLDWNDTRTYITITRENNKATVIEPKYFSIASGEHSGGCAEGEIVLKVNEQGILYFPEKDKR